MLRFDDEYPYRGLSWINIGLDKTYFLLQIAATKFGSTQLLKMSSYAVALHFSFAGPQRPKPQSQFHQDMVCWGRCSGADLNLISTPWDELEFYQHPRPPLCASVPDLKNAFMSTIIKQKEFFEQKTFSDQWRFFSSKLGLDLEWDGMFNKHTSVMVWSPQTFGLLVFVNACVETWQILHLDIIRTQLLHCTCKVFPAAAGSVSVSRGNVSNCGVCFIRRSWIGVE